MTERLRQVFGLDTRSLALGRVGLGLLLLWDLIVRAGQIHVFYTDGGRSWNAEAQGKDRLASFEIVFGKELTRPRGTPPEISQVELWSHRCFKP